MSRSATARHLRLALERWPRDALRPEMQLQDVLTKRLASLEADFASASASSSSSSTLPQLQQVSALYALLDDRFKNRYRISGKLFEPRSRPTYYQDLVKDLEEAPTRGLFKRWAVRLKAMVRLRD